MTVCGAVVYVSGRSQVKTLVYWILELKNLTLTSQTYLQYRIYVLLAVTFSTYRIVTEYSATLQDTNFVSYNTS